ncbi:flagellin [Roseibium sp. RKSG952]|uniref:flagellin n=1 Tax=Roseibium sp. RKSG952 TaxID=2529384 RepID=UPI0012BC5223|nr:flagellin [Roseibium sp. RKSG952]MTH97452.1 flagellin [Roseibium sp. RKSG952]
MAMRVSTFGQTSAVLQNALTTQAKLSEKQIQQSSGIISSDYAGLGSAAGTLVDLEVEMARSSSYISTAEQAASRIEIMYSSLSGVSDLLTTMRSELSALSVTEDDDLASVTILAENYLEETASLLNTQYEGRYLFSGTETGTAPVDLGSYSVTDYTVPDTSYYQGNSDIVSAHVGSERNVAYGVTGDESGFEQTLRAFAYIADATTLTSEDIGALSDLLIEAQDAVIAQMATLGVKASSLESVVSSEEEVYAALSDLAAETISVDIAQVAVDSATYETQLQASYAALGSLSDLSLLDYLR